MAVKLDLSADFLAPALHCIKPVQTKRRPVKLGEPTAPAVVFWGGRRPAWGWGLGQQTVLQGEANPQGSFLVCRPWGGGQSQLSRPDFFLRAKR